MKNLPKSKFFLTFPFFEASLRGLHRSARWEWTKSFNHFGPVRHGERGMKDTDHFLADVPFTSAVNGSIEEH